MQEQFVIDMDQLGASQCYDLAKTIVLRGSGHSGERHHCAASAGLNLPELEPRLNGIEITYSWVTR